MPPPQIHMGPIIIGFGVCLFLALVCLLKWQHRRDIYNKVRVQRGLRGYVSKNSAEEDPCTDPGTAPTSPVA